MWKISKQVFSDLIRSKTVIIYFLLMSVFGWGMFAMEGQAEKVLLVFLQITLIVLPLITLVLSISYYYNSQEFMMLLLAQPIKRSTLIFSFLLALIFAFSICYFLGLGLPLLLFYATAESLLLLMSGVFLTFIFVALAFLIGISFQDKAKGMGVALIIWAFFAFVYDGLLLFLMYQWADYPIEELILVLTFFNPIDIARIMVIMQTEAAALVGLSGAVFEDVFGSKLGFWMSTFCLFIWGFIPVILGKKKFTKKDL